MAYLCGPRLLNNFLVALALYNNANKSLLLRRKDKGEEIKLSNLFEPRIKGNCKNIAWQWAAVNF